MTLNVHIVNTIIVVDALIYIFWWITFWLKLFSVSIFYFKFTHCLDSISCFFQTISGGDSEGARICKDEALEMNDTCWSGAAKVKKELGSVVLARQEELLMLKAICVVCVAILAV